MNTPRVIKAIATLSLTSLFAGCAMNDMVDARLTFTEPTTRTDNSALKYGEIKSYTLTGTIADYITDHEDPRNQQEKYGDLLLDYRADNYKIDPNTGIATLKNTGIGGSAYNLYSPASEAPQKKFGISGMGNVLSFNNLDNILLSANSITPSDFNESDGFTVYLSGYLTCNVSDLSPGPNLDNIFQIGSDSGTHSNRAPVVISQHAENPSAILARSAGKGGSSDYQDAGCNTPFVIIHRSEGNGGPIETVMLNQTGATYLDKATWYSNLINTSPDFLRHDTSRMELVTPLTPTNGKIAIGGNPDISNSRASFNLKNLQFYNQPHGFTRSMLISTWNAKQAGITAPRILLGSLLSSEYMDVDLSTIVSAYKIESADIKRTEAIDLYTQNSAFLTIEDDIATKDPICLSDQDSAFIPFWMAETETSTGQRRCLQQVIPWFGEIKVVATDTESLSSNEASSKGLSTFTSFVKSQPTVMFANPFSNTAVENQYPSTNTIDTMQNVVELGDPNSVTKILIEAYQPTATSQPSTSFNAGDDQEFTYHINSREAVAFDGLNDSMIVRNLSESNLSLNTLATQGFIYSAVIQLGEHYQNDNTYNTVLRFGGLGVPVIHLTQNRNDSSILDVRDAGTIVPGIETNNLPVALTVHSAPVSYSVESGYGQGEVSVFINGEEIVSRKSTNWNNVDSANLTMSIGANAHNNYGVKNNTFTPFGLGQIGLWAGHEDYNKKVAKTFSSILTQSFGITAKGIPELGPRAIDAEQSFQPVLPYLMPKAQ